MVFSGIKGRETGNEKLVGIIDLQHIGYKNIVSRLYKGLRHEVLSEANYKEIIGDILDIAPKA